VCINTHTYTYTSLRHLQRSQEFLYKGLPAWPRVFIMMKVWTALEQLLWYVPVQDRTDFMPVRCVISVTELQKTYLVFMDTKKGLSKQCLFVVYNATDVLSVTVVWAIIMSSSGVSKSHLCLPNLGDILSSWLVVGRVSTFIKMNITDNKNSYFH